MLHIAASAMTPANISWDFIIGGLALFLFGIQFMGDGLKSIAGEKLREYIDRYTNKPWKGILVGSIITVFIQSSSATSAIAIGFVRAGLMSLEQSIGIIIGANIGTTVTAFLIGLKVETLALYFVFLGVLITLFAKRKKQTYMGQIVLGFGLLFFGLRLMGDELSKLGQMDFFTTLATTMQNQPILGFVCGTLMTAVVQSSSAVVGIIQKIYDSGAMTLTAALPFVFGSNIGTTVTAVFASIGGSTSAKRAAAVNVLFNVIGSVIFMFLLTPYVDFITFLSDKYAISPMMQIAMAHILRTIVISILAYPCINLMVSVIKKIIPGEEERIEVDLEGLDPKLAASLPAGVPDTLAFIAASLSCNEVRSAGRSDSLLSVTGFPRLLYLAGISATSSPFSSTDFTSSCGFSGSVASSSMPIASSPFSSMLSKALSSARRSSFSESSASCGNGLSTSAFAVSS